MSHQCKPYLGPLSIQLLGFYSILVGFTELSHLDVGRRPEMFSFIIDQGPRVVITFSLEFHSASVSKMEQKVSIKVFAECPVTVLINVSKGGESDSDI